MIKNMDKEFLNGQMGSNIKDNGLLESNMALVIILILKDKY
jgi:hypothetical protein